MTTGEELFGKSYDRGEIVFREGDTGDAMYVILSGAVEISRKIDGKDTLLGRLRRGEFFGESALIGHLPRMATATAAKRARLIPLTLGSLLDRANDDPTVILQLLGALSVRLQAANQLVGSLVQTDENLSRTWDTCAPESPPSQSPSTPPSVLDKAAPAPGTSDQPLFAVDSTACIWYEPGQTIFREGEQGDAMYFIVEGAVEIVQGSGDAGDRLALLTTHDFFGEMAIITGAPRTASATADSRTCLFPVTREEFLAKIHSAPDLGLFIAQVLIARLQCLVSRKGLS